MITLLLYGVGDRKKKTGTYKRGTPLVGNFTREEFRKIQPGAIMKSPSGKLRKVISTSVRYEPDENNPGIIASIARTVMVCFASPNSRGGVYTAYNFTDIYKTYQIIKY